MSRLPALGPRGEGWVALQFVALGAIAWAGRIDASDVPALAGPIPMVAGAVLIVVGGAIAVRGYLDLVAARAFTAFPYPRPDGSLVETGAYRLVRHPLYAGLILGALGYAIVRASAMGLAATAALFVVLDLKRRREETWLAERFPGYDAYRRRARALIPYLY
jgi:protein-S-isoprenylcysteine O-methyltransferase Ste14